MLLKDTVRAQSEYLLARKAERLTADDPRECGETETQKRNARMGLRDDAGESRRFAR